MCGISGIINHRSFNNIDLMVQAQSKRGPDNSSYFCFNDINSSLGHNRLTIIDKSINANQPFFDQQRNFSIVFNGEIYNYIEIKQKLKSLGYNFTSNSDTEVVLLVKES
jgi:asparagine synthase (glutamine-hydrolysing)